MNFIVNINTFLYNQHKAGVTYLVLYAGLTGERQSGAKHAGCKIEDSAFTAGDCGFLMTLFDYEQIWNG